MLAALLLAGFVAAADAPDFAKDTLPDRISKDEMASGKSVAALRDKVKALWPSIVFNKAGKKVNYTVKLETDDGNIEIEFLPDVAPNHVRSFVCLAKVGYFDGLNFHRCLANFMIQGGCPNGNGNGGPGYRLRAEFNRTPHDEGVLSMARQGDPAFDSAGSQFFICLTRDGTKGLDNKYTVFGKVKTGMEAVKKIVARPVGNRNDGNTINPCKIKKATVTEN